MAITKKTHSLRFDLLVDLGLLTFAALIISEGLLIILLRIELPEDLGDLARSYLRPLHESFIQTESFQHLDLQSPHLPKALENAFTSHLSRLEVGERWAHATVDFLPETTEKDGALVPLRRSFLLLIPTIYEFQYYAHLSQSRGALRYSWSIVPFQESLTQFKFRAFLLTLLVETILVLSGYWFLFRKNILIPIDRLSKVSKAFLQENWNARSEVERHDELGSVAEALNEMASNIQEKESKLVQTIDSLKRANEEIAARQNEQLNIEKLASIGRLAAGVAHEVGNPLGAISGYIDILRRSMKKKSGIADEDLELCDRIETETNRISRIIRALLQQARPAKDRISSIPLKSVVVRSLQLAQIPPVVDVSYDFEDEEAEVFAEEDQLVQVFLNILVNARHALELKVGQKEEARLKIRCMLRKLPFYRGNDSTGYDTSVVRSLKPESYWVLSIEDNGIGISDADQKKLFEPFFSTKAPGKGSGLGLYVSKSIVESFRGAIVVRSALNYGTSFSVFLPKARGVDELLTAEVS